MPINRILKEGNFEPEDVDRLNRAFAMALNLLGLIDRNEPHLRDGRLQDYQHKCRWHA
jgi:hypothetical protein